jgi:hypothetical protein
LEKECLDWMKVKMGPEYVYTLQKENQKYIIPKLCLLKGVMQALEVGPFKFHYANGLCPAMMVDKKLWMII